MYLHQKLNYKYKCIKNDTDLVTMLNTLEKEKPNYAGFDTETDGLHIITAKPFLVSFGFNDKVYVLEYNPEWFKNIINIIIQLNIPLFAHNAKFDYHMVWNGGSKIPDEAILYDSITVARLTENADERISMSLESLGTRYVDDEAKFAGHIIKDLIKKERKVRKDKLRKELIENFPNARFSTTTQQGKIKGTGELSRLLERYDKTRTHYVNDDDIYFKFIDEHYKEPNYEDIYHQEPELLRNYAADDIVIMLEYLKRALPVLKQVDKDFTVLKREGRLIHAVAWMEKTGFKVDIDYILKCREKMVDYRNLLYSELMIYTGKEFSVGQHEFIKKLIVSQFGISIEKADEKALKKLIENTDNEILINICKNIIELRTVDKWLSTYIDGKLNAIVNGRIYTDINNNGAVSGRVSCDMQQQPKEGFTDRDGNELFHPRSMFVCDEGYRLFFIDQSQMELRMQAYYTMLYSSEPDMGLCRAYMPYKCYNDNSTLFDPYNPEHLKHFGERKWYECGTGKEWEPTDLHSLTTIHAFPNLDPSSPEFKKKRKLGKRCNFLKVYQGGVIALKESLDVDLETAEALDSAFYKAFPRIKDYQDWVNNQLSLYGYIENLYGRRYYMSNSREFYKGCNYLIQGSCADLIKLTQIKIYDYVKEKGLKMRLVLPVHDENILLVPYGEEKYIGDIKAIMEDTIDVIKSIPFIAEVEMSETTWRDKKEYKLEGA